ncbi:MAG: type II toxin-antitoxin system VapC family toxin [Solirubrobacterales bacterium]
MILYFDTSALVKLVIVEPGSELVAELWGTQLRAASSILCYPEGRAALAAARRGRRLSAPGYDRAREEFESLHGELVLVGIDGLLARRAGELAEEHELRGYDAVHLASALALGADTTLITWNEDLKRAAAQRGCAIAPAN